ncbi:helix-turn-helix domain-containing protein [Paraburkholderia sp. J7]|uniref:helix-turn-helix transcriptional regulator n=1 Tax=Paraburkholderia sp. J7 TaxID=2805438 RepID=UPI002AB6EFEA|nr:helix-turn-helix domain-containing protein [Paraburkholderia sp. J7]
MFYKSNMDSNSSLQSLAERLGIAIRARRVAAQLSQRDLALALGVRRQTVADLEAGRNVGLHVALGALVNLGLADALAVPDACAPASAPRRSPAPAWPANWQVVENWDRFDAAARSRLEAEMRRAPSAAANRREAFVMASLDVRSARVIHSPEFEAPGEF